MDCSGGCDIRLHASLFLNTSVFSALSSKCGRLCSKHALKMPAIYVYSDHASKFEIC